MPDEATEDPKNVGGESDSAAASSGLAAPPTAATTSAAGASAAGPGSAASSSSGAAQPASAATGAPAAGGASGGATDGDGKPVSFGQKVLHGIMSALGATEEVQYERNAEGKLIATAVKSGPGQQWKRIIAGTLTGAAAGASVRPGPGHLARAASAGFSAGENMVQGADQKKREQADEDFEQQQKTLVRKAQTAHLTQETTNMAFELGRRKVTSQFEDAARENSFAQSIAAGGSGSIDLGIAKNLNEVIALHKNVPGLLEQQAHGNVIGIPHVNESGLIDGMHYALVTPEWKQAKLGQDEAFYQLRPPLKPGEKPQVERQTVKAGTMTNGDFWTARMAGEKEIMGWYTEQSKETAATTRERETQAAENKREEVKQEHEDRRAGLKGGDKATADEKRRADLGNNLKENLDQLEDIVTRRPDLFGALRGRLTSLKQSVGTSDPDVAALKNISDQIGMAKISSHSMRSASHVEKAADAVLNSYKNSPAATKAAIKSARESVQTFLNDVENKGGGAGAGSGAGKKDPFAQFGGKAVNQ